MEIGRRESPAGEPDALTFTHELLAPQMVTQVPAARDLRLLIFPRNRASLGGAPGEVNPEGETTRE